MKFIISKYPNFWELDVELDLTDKFQKTELGSFPICLKPTYDKDGNTVHTIQQRVDDFKISLSAKAEILNA